MTNEEKQLLLKDLCARLPYGVKGRVYAETTNGEYDINGDMIFFDSPFDVILDDINTSTEELHVVAIGNEDTVDFIEDEQTCGDPYTIDEFKPYLRPMSSMTEEERDELYTVMDWYGETDETGNVYTKGQEKVYRETFYEYTDWLNVHHFDYRGLIEKGLALKAPEGMYKNE